MDLLLVAFAVFVVVEMIKAFTPQPLPSVVKLVAVIALGVLYAWALVGWEDDAYGLLLGLAGAGLAALVHKVHRWFSAAGDGHQLAVMQMGRRRP